MRKNTNTLGVILFSLFCSSMARSLTLEEVIKHTLDTNPEILAAQYEKQAIEAEVSQAKAGYLPHLSVSAGLGRETREAPATGMVEREADRREFGLQARQMLFDGFATSAEVQRQKARLESGEFGEWATSERLALQVADVYLSVLRQAKLLDLARETLWEHQNIFDQMKLRQQSGVGSKADLDQIAARLALANANMIVAQTNLEDAQVGFYRVTGLFPNLVDMTEPDAAGTLPSSRENALEQAIEQHPQLKSASADVAAARAQYRASGSQYWPRISLEADKRWDENVGTIDGEDEDLVVAVRLTYDLYKGGANKSRRKQTAHLVEEAKSIRNNARRQVSQSMSLSWNAYEALSKQMPFLENHVTAAKNTREAYIKQFNIGKRTLLDLLNTETEFVEARRALTNARFDQLYARYRILNAAGQLLAALRIQQNEQPR